MSNTVKDAIPFYRVVCAVIYHPYKSRTILAAQRSEFDKTIPLHWEFPGGKIEKNESEEQALKREILEELGLDISVGNRLQPSLWGCDLFNIELIPFLCSCETDHINMNDHHHADWFDLDQLSSLKWAPADVPIVQELIEFENSTA